MKIAMTLIAVVTIAIVILVTQNDITEQLKLEKIDNAELQLNIQTRETQVEQLESELEEVVNDKEKTEAEKQEEIDRLRSELQAKKDREMRVALSQKAEAQQPSEVNSTNCEDYRGLLSQYSGWNVDTMLRAMRLESGCNPRAVGDQYVIGGIYAPSCGLLQNRVLPGRPSCEELKDPATNIASSYKIWQSQGYCAWTTLHGTPSCPR